MLLIRRSAVIFALIAAGSLELHETLGAYLLGMAGTGEHAEASVVVYAHVPFFGAFGGDEDT